MGEAHVELFDVPSEAAGGDVPVAVVAPPAFDPASGSLPLCLTLHGGGADRTGLTGLADVYRQLWDQGAIAPMVMVSPSTGPLSWYAGPWEDVILDELPTVMADRYGTRTDPAGTVMTGISMGGFGTLKLGFKHPDRFAAIAALEPGITPGFRRADATPRNTFFRFPMVDAALYGDPIDEDRWQADMPASLARANADVIRSSGMEIYLEAGDEDGLNLHDGTEFLHRVLWDLDIRHHYQLVRWAGHLGPSFSTRIPQSLRFLSDALAGGLSAPTELELTADEQAWLDWLAGGMAGERREIDLASERAPALLDLTYAEPRAAAAATDPTCARAYAHLPPTT